MNGTDDNNDQGHGDYYDENDIVHIRGVFGDHKFKIYRFTKKVVMMLVIKRGLCSLWVSVLSHTKKTKKNNTTNDISVVVF